MRQFGEFEAVIMNRLWAWGRPALVREMVDDLQRDRQIAYTTVMTVMDNLYRKGWLRRHLGRRRPRPRNAGAGRGRHRRAAPDPAAARPGRGGARAGPGPAGLTQ